MAGTMGWHDDGRVEMPQQLSDIHWNTEEIHSIENNGMRIHTGHPRHTISLSAAKALFALAVALVVCLCCSREPSSAQLDRAEALLFDNPDSAMALVSEQRTPRQALLYNAAHYVKYKEIDKDLEEYTYTHYIEKKIESTKSELCMAKLFHGIRLYEEEQFTEAMKILLEAEENIDELPHPYFKGVMQYYIACIYLKKDLYENSLKHFKRELLCAMETKRAGLIANSENHVSLLFYRLDEKDSCFCHIRRALTYQEEADSSDSESVYNNLAMVMEKYCPDSTEQIEYNLQQALGYSGNRSSHIMANLAELYYRSGRDEEGDSLAQIVMGDSSAELNTRMIMSRTLHRHYEENGKIDSAYKYQKLFLRYDSIVNNLSDQKDIIRVDERMKGREMVEERNVYIYVIICFATILSVGLTVVYGRPRHTRQEQRRQKEKSDAHCGEHEEKECSRTDADSPKTCSDRQKNTDVEEMADMASTSSQEKGHPVFSDTALLKIFDRSVRVKGALKEYYVSLVNALMEEDKNNMDFMDAIMSALPDLNERNRAICILIYAKNLAEEDIVRILDFQSVTAYRTAKSRLKTKLSKQKEKNESIEMLLHKMSEQK